MIKRILLLTTLNTCIIYNSFICSARYISRISLL